MLSKSQETVKLINPHPTYMSVSLLSLILSVEKEAVSGLDQWCWRKSADNFDNDPPLCVAHGSVHFNENGSTDARFATDSHNMSDDLDEVP
jgi:hypothetical protein